MTENAECLTLEALYRRDGERLDPASGEVHPRRSAGDVRSLRIRAAMRWLLYRRDKPGGSRSAGFGQEAYFLGFSW